MSPNGDWINVAINSSMYVADIQYYVKPINRAEMVINQSIKQLASSLDRMVGDFFDVTLENTTCMAIQVVQRSNIHLN